MEKWKKVFLANARTRRNFTNCLVLAFAKFLRKWPLLNIYIFYQLLITTLFWKYPIRDYLTVDSTNKYFSKHLDINYTVCVQILVKCILYLCSRYKLQYKVVHVYDFCLISFFSLPPKKQLVSTLTIERADMHHAGKFTCAPSYAKPDTVTVHVIDGDFYS